MTWPPLIPEGPTAGSRSRSIPTMPAPVLHPPIPRRRRCGYSSDPPTRRVWGPGAGGRAGDGPAHSSPGDGPAQTPDDVRWRNCPACSKLAVSVDGKMPSLRARGLMVPAPPGFGPVRGSRGRGAGGGLPEGLAVADGLCGDGLDGCCLYVHVGGMAPRPGFICLACARASVAGLAGSCLPDS